MTAFDGSIPTPEQLLAQADWVRALARRLVRDAWHADDVAQETLMTALARPPRVAPGSEPQLRAWLGRVAHNVARLGRRGEARRAARERVAARPDRGGDAAEVVARTEQLRRVVDAVLALPEPYRTAVLLSCQDGLGAGEIAARTGATPAAVRKRVSRGLQQLRARLDDEAGGDRARWVTALAPLAGVVPRPGLLAAIGAMAMTTKAMLGAAGGLALVAWLCWPPSAGRTVAMEHDHPPGAAESAEVAAAGPAAGVAVSPPRVAVGAAGDVAALVHGRVVEAGVGAPLAGVAVLFTPPGVTRLAAEETPECVSGADGSFSFSAPAESTGLLFRGPGCFERHVDPANVPRPGGGPWIVELAGLGAVRVTVVDEAGGPLEGRVVRYEVEPTIGSEDQRWHWRRSWRAGVTDARGELVVESLPAGMPIEFGIGDSFARPGRVVIDPALRFAEVRLVPRRWARLTGRLVWADGTAAAGVEVTWHGTADSSGAGGLAVEADAEGRFAFARLDAGRGALFFGGGEREALPARLVAGETTDLGDVAVGRPVAVEGVLRTQAGVDPARYHVEAFRAGAQLAAARVEAGGRFAVRVSPGPVLLLVVRHGYWDPILPYVPRAAASALVRAPAAGVELEVEPSAATGGGVLVGRVEGAAETATLKAFAIDEPLEWVQPEPVAEAEVVLEDGRFRSPELDVARYRVLLEIAGGGHAYSAVAVPAAGEEVDIGVLRAGNGTLRGTVRAPSGEALAGAVVGATGHLGGRLEVRAGDDGRFAFPDLPAGPWALDARVGAQAFARGLVVHVVAGGVQDVAVVAPPTAELAGRVVAVTGTAAGRVLRLQRQDSNRSWTATTDDGGLFSFTGLEPGGYRCWMHDEFVCTVELAPGQRRALEVRVGVPAIELELRRDGARMTDVQSLFAMPADPGHPAHGRWRHGRRVGAGVFEVAVPAGPVALQIDVPGLGNNQVLVALAQPAPGERRAVVELAATGVEVVRDAAVAHGPAPAAYLLALPAGPFRSIWGDVPELQAEVEPDGTVRFPHVPAGATVRITGLGPRGVRVEREVRVEPAGWTRVVW